MKNKLWLYIGFFAVLLAGFYLMIFRDYDFSASKLAVINPSIPEFSFVDQDGNPFSNKNTEGKVYVAEYFFTTCKGICPKMNANMRRVFDRYQPEKDFMILSHTCMPETDSIPLMKAYEQKMLGGKLIQKSDGSYKIDTVNLLTSFENKQWYFLTGNKTELYKMARQGYMIDNGKPDSTQNINDQFIHTQFFALVDKVGRVRGIYDGLKEAEIQKLLVDIDGLLDEKIDHKRFMNGFSNNPN